MAIETNRLVIRPPHIDDFNEYWLMSNDEIAKKYTGGVITLSYDEALDRHTRVCNEFDGNEKTNCIFSVIEKATNKYVGYCGFKYCEILNDIEILYGFSRDAWGNGYGYEAAKNVLNYGFEVLKLEKIVAAVNPKNIPSEKILIKIGMQNDGQILWKDQGMVNKYVITC